MQYRYEKTQIERNSTCAIHGDFVEKGLLMAYMKNEVWKGCEICRAQRMAERDAKELAMTITNEQQRLDDFVRRSGIPERFKDKTFDGYQCDLPAQTKALQKVLDFRDRIAREPRYNGSLILTGPTGTGKSHLANALAMSLASQKTSLYLTVNQMICMVRDTWRRDSPVSETQVYRKLASVDLLILDEVGMQSGSENETVIMFNVTNERYANNKPTVFISNLNLIELSTHLSARTFDRLREGGVPVEFSWESYRRAPKNVVKPQFNAGETSNASKRVG